MTFGVMVAILKFVFINGLIQRMKLLKTASILGVTASIYYGIKKMAKTSAWHGFASKATMIAGATGLVVMPTYAMSESLVQSFANTLSDAANSQNIGQVSQLIDDEAVISMTRQGKTSTLDKNAYLQLLQKSWAGAKDYRYHIHLGDVIVTGNQAKAQVNTTETWIKDNKRTTLNTNSRATLVQTDKGVVLLRAVSQITIE